MGKGDFTCCKRNHIFDRKKIQCDKPLLRGVLEQMIDDKVRLWGVGLGLRLGLGLGCPLGSVLVSLEIVHRHSGRH